MACVDKGAGNLHLGPAKAVLWWYMFVRGQEQKSTQAVLWFGVFMRGQKIFEN